MKCSNCGVEIEKGFGSTSNLCYSCNEISNGWVPEKKRGYFINILAVLIPPIFIAVVVLIWPDKQDNSKASNLPSSKSVTQKNTSEVLTLNSKQDATVSSFISDGLIDLKAYNAKAYISPILWAQADYTTKYELCRCLAIKCGNATGDNIYAVTVYDMKSAKKIAHYQHEIGFKVY